MSKQQDIRKELETIKKKHKGILRPHDVVEFARDEDTALHSQFTWDDGDAAEKYRIWEARQVIRIHVDVVKDDAKPVRAFVSLLSDRKADGGGYRSFNDVMTNEDLRAQLLAQALDEMELYQSKYEHLTELVPIFEAFRKVVAKSAQKPKGNTVAARHHSPPRAPVGV